MAGFFLLYDVVDDAHGRITGSVTALNVQAEMARMDSEGQRFLYVPLDGHEGSLRLEDGEVVGFDVRPDFSGSWDKPTVPVGETATLSQVPPCTITINGPMLRWAHNHQGGDAKFAFLIPGTYTFEFECFPMKPQALKLVVRSPVEAVAPEAASMEV